MPGHHELGARVDARLERDRGSCAPLLDRERRRRHAVVGVARCRAVAREVLERAEHRAALPRDGRGDAVGGGLRVGTEHAARDERRRVRRDIRDDAEVHVDPDVGQRGRARREGVLGGVGGCRAQGLGAGRAVPRQALHLAALLVDAHEHGRLGVGLHGTRERREFGGRARHVVAHEDQSRDALVDERTQRRGVGSGRMQHQQRCGLLLDRELGHPLVGPLRRGRGRGRRLGRRGRSGAVRRRASGDADERGRDEQRHGGGSDPAHPHECTLRVRAAAECPRG